MHNLEYIHTDDISELKGFFCGVYEMDFFIQKSMQRVLDTNKDLRNYIVKENNIPVALCTLKVYDMPLSDRYTFLRTEYIEYLAVRRESQCNGVGRQILEWIESNTSSDIKHIVVDAFISDVTSYTAVPFYKKCGFKAIQNKHPMAETVRMIKTLKKQ